MSSIVIAIDGPAGAGKSTVARLLSQKLGLKILDTGAMYRVIALKARERDILIDDIERLVDLARSTQIDFRDGDPQRVMMDGADVTSDIRSLEIGQLASGLSIHPEVRSELVQRQQDLVRSGGFVLEGRDVTTVVAPNADLKIFLTASIEERARRRWVEIKARGEDSRLQDVVRDVVERDHRDYSRHDSPLELAEDAVIIESYGLTAEQVAEKITSMAGR